MCRYLFVTYGASGWRGVQIRALRIAKYLPKEEVLFWNLYDSEFIKDWGFEVETKDASLVDPGDIKFPAGVEAVIFADLPSNEFFNYSLFVAAVKKGIRVIICEQTYRHGQLLEGVYKKFIENSDLFLVNATSIFKEEKTEIVKVVPPQIECDFSSKTKEEICHKYQIPSDVILIYGVGYHEKVLERIKTITERLSQKNYNFYTIVTGSKDLKEVKREGRLIILPFNIGDDYFKILYACDLALVKFGFLQILEAVALGKPIIVLGAGGFTLRTPEKLDEVYKKTLRFDLEITDETFKYIERFVTDGSFRKEVSDKVKALHNGELFGAKKAALEILAVCKKPVRQKKTGRKRLAILVNNEIFEKEEWLKREEDVYPLCFITGMPTENFSNKMVPEEVLKSEIRKLNLDWSKEVLPHSFKNVFVFSERRLDGFVDMFPWYEDWVENLTRLLEKADEIYVTDQGKMILGTLLLPHKSKVRFF